MLKFSSLDEAKKAYLDIIGLIFALNPYSVKDDNMTRGVIENTVIWTGMDFDKDILFDAIRRNMTYAELFDRIKQYVE